MNVGVGTRNGYPSLSTLILEKFNTMKTAVATTKKQVLRITRLIGPTFTH